MQRLLIWQKLMILTGISMFSLAGGLSLAAWYSFKQAQNQIRIEGYNILSKQTEQFLKNQVQERARNLNIQFAQTKSIASYGSGILDMQFRMNVENQETVDYVLKKLFQSLANPSANVYFNSKKLGLIVFSPNKQKILGTFGTSFQLSSYFPAKEDFLKTEANTAWTTPHPSAFDGGYDWVVDVISPINRNKPYESFVGVSISLTDLITQFNQLHPTRGSYSFLMDHNQNLVAALPHARLELAPNGKFIEQGLIKLVNTDNEILNTALKEMSLGRSSLMKVVIKEDEKYLAFHPLDGINWSLGIVVPVSIATSASTQLQSIVALGMKEALLRMIIGALVIFGISLLIGSLLIRKLLIPLSEVSEASRSMLAGDYKQRVLITSSDEISHLALVFNQMAVHIDILVSRLEQRAQELEKLNESLEHKVFERTIKLEEKTKQLHIEIKEREDAQKALTVANETLQLLATIDGLTQIPNRRYFDERLKEEWSRLTREKQPLSLILLDVDYFKQYNDYYGHQAGDACLVRIAEILSKSIHRPADFVARFGGEEFVLVLPYTELKGAMKISKKIMNNIKAEAIPHGKSKVNKCVTISIGIANIIPTLKLHPEELISLADKALYISKQKGRNKYSVL